jgi:hypothetical protein
MKVDLPYADGVLTADLPDDSRRLSSAAETALPPIADVDAAVRRAGPDAGGPPPLNASVT